MLNNLKTVSLKMQTLSFMSVAAPQSAQSKAQALAHSFLTYFFLKLRIFRMIKSPGKIQEQNVDHWNG